jgi:hypothetical protein
MSLLGFDALGNFVLGQIGDDTQPTLIGGGAWEGPLRKIGLSAAVIATTTGGFVPQPPAIAAVAPPVGGYFSVYSQPPPKVGFNFYEQPQPAFRMFPIAGTPGPLVFSTFVERYTKPPQQSEPWVKFEIAPPFKATFTGFDPFNQPRFSTSYKHIEQPSPLFEVRLTPPPPFTSFSNFGIPLQTKYTFANEQWNINFELVLFPPQAGGTSWPLHDPRRKRGLEPIKKRFERPVIDLKPLPVPPRSRPIKPPAEPVVDLVDKTRLPDVLALEHQVMSAQDIADVHAFLTTMEADEQDAQDIADILAFLDGPQPNES